MLIIAHLTPGAVTTNGIVFARRFLVLGLVRSVTRATQSATRASVDIEPPAAATYKREIYAISPKSLAFLQFPNGHFVRSAERAAPRTKRRALGRTNVLKNTLDAIDAPPP